MSMSSTDSAVECQNDTTPPDNPQTVVMTDSNEATQQIIQNLCEIVSQQQPSSKGPKTQTFYKVECEYCKKLISKNNISSHHKRCKIKRHELERIDDNNPHLMEKIKHLESHINFLENQVESHKASAHDLATKYHAEHKLRVEGDKKYNKLCFIKCHCSDAGNCDEPQYNNIDFNFLPEYVRRVKRAI